MALIVDDTHPAERVSGWPERGRIKVNNKMRTDHLPADLPPGYPGGVCRVKMDRKGLLWLAVVGILALIQGPFFYSKAADLKQFFKNDPTIPWHIEADLMTYDRATNQTTASGNAIFRKNDFRLSADEVRYDRARMAGEAAGNVHVISGEDWMTGDRIEIDLQNRTGTLHKGDLFIKQSNYHVSGGIIRKTGDNSYYAEDVEITTCDGEVPDWAIGGKKLDVTIEGYGFVHHAFFRIKDVPVLYSPFFIFPVKTKRQTGFLMPEFGNSDRKGVEVTQPFFWAINDSSDATFYEHFMSRRGNKLGAEYRYVMDDKSHGAVMFDWLKDRKVDDGTGSSSVDYGYTDDEALRTNSDRYWLRMKLDQQLPLDITAQLSLDVVSDQDYLHEFKSGLTGYHDSVNFFVDQFGHDLDDYTDPVRTNRLNFNRIWPTASANAEFRWLDDVIARRQDGPDENVQRLPSVSLDSTRQSYLDLPLHIGFDSQYAYLFRKDGIRGHRADFYPRIYVPYRLGRYVSLEPSLGLRETVWYTDHPEASNGDSDRSYNREFYDFRLNLASEMFKVYRTGSDGEGRLKHLMRFQAEYDYAPELNQTEYPRFDALDRIENRELITYSWIHSLVTRSAFHPSGSNGGPNTPVSYNYHQLARLKFEQSYDLFKEKEDIPEPFSPITAELELDVTPEVYLKADTGWSTYCNDFVSHNIACGLKDHRGDELFVEHRYVRDNRETLYTDVLLRVASWLWLYADFERNLLADKDLSKGVGLSYQDRCWSFDVRYAREEDNNEVAFSISLYGLGEFGSGSKASGKARYLESLRSNNKVGSIGSSLNGWTAR